MKFIQASHDDNLLLFVDAYDVVFVRGPEDFLGAMDDVLHGQDAMQVVYGAEVNCWPFLHPHHQNCPELGMGYSHGGDGKPGKPRGNNVCRRNYPSSPTAYRYLNTGAVVGAAGALRPLMDSLPLLRGIIPPRCIIDDQGLMNHAFLYTHDRWGSSQNNERWQELNLARFGPSPCMKFDKPVGLDTRARLFHNLGAGAIADLWYPASSSRPRNNATGSEPYLLHCNGDKAPFEGLSRQALKGRPLDLAGAKFRCGDVFTTMEELCGSELRDIGYF